MKGYEYDARVVSVVDGDTVHLDVDVGFCARFSEKFRLARIDAPEKSNQEGWGRATQRVQQLLPVGSVCRLRSLGRDKYGRWLAELFVDGRSVNDTLLAEGLVAAYSR